MNTNTPQDYIFITPDEYALKTMKVTYTNNGRIDLIKTAGNRVGIYIYKRKHAFKAAVAAQKIEMAEYAKAKLEQAVDPLKTAVLRYW